MRHLAAYLLLVVGGNESPSAADVKTLLQSAGVESDDERLGALITELEGKNIEELVALGSARLMKGGVGGGAAPAAAAAGGGVAAPAAAEKPKEKPKVEEVDALDGGMDMFGGSGGKDY